MRAIFDIVFGKYLLNGALAIVERFVLCLDVADTATDGHIRYRYEDQLKFGAVAAQVSGVSNAYLGAVKRLSLEVLVIYQEQCSVELQAAVEQSAFPAQFVAGSTFFVELPVAPSATRRWSKPPDLNPRLIEA